MQDVGNAKSDCKRGFVFDFDSKECVLPILSIESKLIEDPYGGEMKDLGRSDGKVSRGNRKPSWMPSTGSIVFWFFFLVFQCYLIWVYHTINFTDFATSESTSSNQNRNDIRQEFEVGRKSSQTSERKSETPKTRNPSQADGTFNGYPIYKFRHKKETQPDDGFDISMDDLYSQFHCVGETWHDADFHKRSKTHHEQSWMFRSCRFQVFCYDTSTQEYAIYLDPEKHKESHTDHHYHHDDKNPHPSPHIQKILDKQKEQLSKEHKEIADDEHPRNTTTDFKHPTFIDDTSTVFRNHTIVVNSNGEVVLGDIEEGKHYGVSIGSVNGKWGLVDIQNLKWFPEVRWGPVPKDSSEYEVYTLPPSVVMIPFHSLSAENPGHLVWDDFLPMYTLLDMFGFLKKRDAAGRGGYTNTNHPSDTSDWTDLLPIRYMLPNMPRGLWASCDWLDQKRDACKHMLSKFGTVMGTRRSYRKFHGHVESKDMVENPNGILNPKTASKLPKISITTNRNVEFRLKDTAAKSLRDPNAAFAANAAEKPKLICAKNGVAGFGAVSDHFPNNGHGWQQWDYFNSYNSGRGNQLWEFRNFMIHNLFESLPKKEAPIVPINSKPDTRRRLDYNVKRIDSLKTRPSVLLGKDQISSYPPSSITDMGPDEPLMVLYSAYSSQRRGGSMQDQAMLLQQAIEESGGPYQFLYGKPPKLEDVGAKVDIIIENHVFSKYTLEEQIQMASRAAVFATFCGGGAITGSFLPKGGGLHLYYGEDSGIEYNKQTGLPARLDWDFFNHCGYLHVKWIPFYVSLQKWPGKYVDGGGYESQALANVDLMRGELLRIHSERVKHYKKETKQ